MNLHKRIGLSLIKTYVAQVLVKIFPTIYLLIYILIFSPHILKTFFDVILNSQ